MSDGEKIKIQPNIDGLEHALEKVLEGEEKLLDDIKEKLLHARIRHEYRVEKKKRGRGSSSQIYREIAEKYFNDPNRTDYIIYILYRKY